MAYKIDYLVPQRVLLYFLHGTMEASDFQNIPTDNFRLMDEGIAPIHTISIIDPQVKYAKNLPTIVAMMKGPDRLHPKVGWMVQVSEQPVHRFVSAWALQVVYKNVRVHSVKNLSEALHFLIDRDVTLGPLDVETLIAQYNAWKETV